MAKLLLAVLDSNLEEILFLQKKKTLRKPYFFEKKLEEIQYVRRGGRWLISDSLVLRSSTRPRNEGRSKGGERIRCTREKRCMARTYLRRSRAWGP